MKTLILMRHAKSSWDSPGTDAERALNARGLAAAKAMGDWLRHQNLTPDEILCSYAVRTMETVERLGLNVAYHPIRALYLAPSELMLDHITRASGDTVLIVAHNPGSGDLAHDLSKTLPDHPRFEDYPTCATSVFTFNVNAWSEITYGSGTLTHFVTPHDL